MTASSPETTLAMKLREVVDRWATSQQRIVVLAADFADSVEWVLDGAPTAAHWLAGIADIEVCTAREWIRIGRRLRELPAIADAFAHGRLSYSKVRTLTRVATERNEVDLLEIAQTVPAGELGRTLAAWMNRHSDPAEIEAHHESLRSVRWRTEPDGMVTFTLRFPPLLAGILIAALTRIVMRAGRIPTVGGHHASAGRFPSLAQQYCDAFSTALTEGGGDAEVVLHVRGDGCTLDDGTPVPDTVVERIASRSFMRALIHDAAGRPINASSRRRHPTSRQKRVVEERDRVCRDCGSAALLEYDHVPSFEVTGHTVVDELELRCAPCHRARHAGTASCGSAAGRRTIDPTPLQLGSRAVG